MPRRHPTAVRSAALAAVLALGWLPCAAGAGGPGDATPGGPRPADPFPVRRLWLPPDQVAGELARVKGGVLQELPLEEFEARLAAARARTGGAEPPRLVTARYRAELQGTALAGPGDWSVYNPGDGPAVLPLDRLRLPLSNVQVGGKESPGRPAILGWLDGKSPGLYLERGGAQSVFFDWSLGGTVSGGAVHFLLPAPPCASGSLELTLPEEYVVTLPGKAALLSGPEDVGRKGFRMWRFAFSGQAQVPFSLHPREGPRAIPPLRLVSVGTAQRMFPDRQESDHEFTIEVFHNVVDRLEFDVDPGLQVLEVVAPPEVQIRRWDPPDRQAGRPLTVWLGDPQRQEPPPAKVPSLVVRCQGPLAAGGAWASPAVHLRGAVPRGETLDVQVHPDLRAGGWDFGAFTPAGVGPGPGGATALKLEGAGGPGAARPSATVHPSGLELFADQVSWWRVEPASTSLVTELAYTVTRGTAHQLPVRLPGSFPGGRGEEGEEWQLESVELADRKLLRNWTTEREGDDRLLWIELERGLRAGERVTVSLRLRASPGREALARGRTLSFPKVVPVGRSARREALGIWVDPLFQATVRGATVEATRADRPGPWGEEPLDFFYTARWGEGEAAGRGLGGALHLTPHAPVLRAECAQSVTFTPGRADVAAELRLQPVVGAAESVDVLLPGPVAGDWSVERRGEPGGVRSVRRLWERSARAPAALAGAADPLAAAALAANVPPGEWWRVTLARPLAGAETLSLRGSVTDEASSGGVWRLPAVLVADATLMEGEVGVAGADVEAEPLLAQGLEAGPGRAFRYSVSTDDLCAAAPPPCLWVGVRPVPASRAATQQCRWAALTTYVGADGGSVHHFRFALGAWRGPAVPVTLPAGAELLLARVQGRWVADVPRHRDRGKWVVSLPVQPHLERHGFELVYRSPAAPGRLWLSVAAPPPGLPAEPLVFRRTWRLPPGAVPLDRDQRLVPHPDPALPEAGDPLASFGRLWGSADPFVAALAAPPGGAAGDRQLRRLLTAERRWREGRPAEPVPVGQALEQLAAEYLAPAAGGATAGADPGGAAGAPAVVVDAPALRGAGVTPATPCPPADGGGPFWEALGLGAVPCPAGVLLTTQARARAWWQGVEAGEAPAALERAVRQAVLDDRDPSGEFVELFHWLAEDHGGPGGGGAPPVEAVAFGYAEGWTEWEPVPGGPDPVTLVVVDAAAVRVLAVALAVVAGLGLWLACRGLSVRWRFRVALLWLAATGAAVVYAPAALREAVWWPALAGVAVTLGWFYAPPARRAGGEGRGAAAGVPLAAAVVLLATGLAHPPARAGGETPFTVYLVGDPDGPPAGHRVLAPPRLLEKLDALLARPAPAARESVVVRVDYEGAAEGGRVVLEARLQVYCFTDDATLTFPLEGDLRAGSVLDGRPIDPVPAGPGSYRVRIQGRKGRVAHLTVPFSLRAQDVLESRQVRFRGPKAFQSRLAVRFPAGTAAAQAVTALGAQQFRRSGDGWELAADLGLADRGESNPLVHLRWQPEASAAVRPELAVAEYHLWDAHPPAASLYSVFSYTITRGSLPAFRIRLPDGVRVRGVEMRRSVDTAADSLAIPVQWWGVGQGGVLEVHPDGPVSGKVHLGLKLVSELATAAEAVQLGLPAALEVAPRGGFLAYRLDDRPFTEKEVGLKLVRQQPEAFLREWTDTLDMWEPRDDRRRQITLTRCYGFRRTGGGEAGVRVAYHASPPRLRQDVACKLHPQHADVRAELAVLPDPAAPAESGGVRQLEWSFPAGLVIAEVAGPDLLHWDVTDRADRRTLHLWVKQTAAETAVRLTGWFRAGAGGVWSPPGGQRGGAGEFRLPAFRAGPSQGLATRVQVTAADCLRVVPGAAEGLKPVGDGPGQVYEAAGPAYSATFAVRRVPVLPEARLLTSAEAVPGGVRVRSVVRYTAAVGTLGPLSVRVRGWRGEPLHLHTSAPAQVTRSRDQRGDAWQVRPAPGLVRECALELTGFLPLGNGEAFDVPAVEAPGADVVGRWLAAGAAGLRAAAEEGLVAEGSRPPPAWRDGPADGPAWGAVWRAAAADWQLALERTPVADAPQVRLVSEEYLSRVARAGRWLHRGVFTFLCSRAAEAEVELPEGARPVLVALDGQPLEPAPVSGRRVRVPVPGSPSAHALCLEWEYAQGREPTGSPELARPRFRAADPVPALWFVHGPAGYELSAGGGGWTRATPTAADFHRSLTELRAAGEGMGPAGGLTSAALLRGQQSFYWHLRQTRLRLAYLGGAGVTVDGQGEVAAALNRLEAENEDLARKLGYELRRVQAAQNPAPAPALCPGGGEFPLRGPVSVWYGPGDAGRLPVTFASLGRQDFRQRLHRLEFLAGSLFCLWVLSFIPGMVLAIRNTWPEQFFGGAILATQAFGFTPVGLAVMGVAVGGRLLYLAAGLRRFLARRRPAARAPASAVRGP